MSIITTAIGLILVYLILSLIVTSMQEAIASWFSLRGKHLGHAIDQMLTNEKTTEQGLELDKSLLEKFQNHPGYRELVVNKEAKGAGKTNHPSYMSATTFASILFHVLDGTDINSITASVNAMADGKLKTFLLESLAQANNDLATFRQKIEHWYDQVMSRVSGWYKRFSHKIIMVLGLLLAIYMNADTLTIYEKMSQVAADSPQAQAINALGDEFANTRYAAYNQQLDEIKQDLASAATQADSVRFDSVLVAHNRQLLTQVDSLIITATANNSPLGLGWTTQEWQTLKNASAWSWINKLLGFLITAFAISLGAPFWFDMLKKIINIRNAGPVHQDSTSTGSVNKVTT